MIFHQIISQIDLRRHMMLMITYNLFNWKWFPDSTAEYTSTQIERKEMPEQKEKV